MGQIFYACAYDIETMTCCALDADKFHANCYSYSGAVFSMHYLLRQKAYRIMWGGRYVVADNYLAKISAQEVLLGFSTYLNYEDFERNIVNLKKKPYYDKVQFIAQNSSRWTNLDVWHKASAFFDWENTHSVDYTGYLVNHSKKKAIDLADYFAQSKCMARDSRTVLIDALPVLTETGGGTQMALFEGVESHSTEHLAGKWCGDLLQIVDELPPGYKRINCCFAHIWDKAEYCFRMFGVDENSLLIGDSEGTLFEGAAINFYGKRGISSYIKVEPTEGGVKFFSASRDSDKSAEGQGETLTE